ncbi:patatin-like phospholipase family protein [Aquibacillus salsiterrae]|uniref:Patatin-like phospholipase family protein n=1 Tax=Aquibacillus salsiterrae TaxID=2950439 RepID=A0A9X3WDM1_9BACI|nr:patatin-like phospholipase family protein [Aquibacillus salsiterrae]MDC3415499.1 patatin-like phospholipase family protein [Aquibacillus salsiterrae]
MKIDAVFSGGGVKAFALLGALIKLEEKQYSYERVAGTSAGAIIAGLLASGYTSKEMERLFLDLDLEKFKDSSKYGKYFPFIKWFKLYFTMGLYKGDYLERWLDDLLVKKGVFTFADLPVGTLKVVTTDLTLGKVVVLPDDLKEFYDIDPATFPVARAIRMSVGIPLFFRPLKLRNKQNTSSVLVDGALVSNFPIWVFNETNKKKKRPTIGLELTEAPAPPPSMKIINTLDLLGAVIDTLTKTYESAYTSNNNKEILSIPVNGVDATSFDLDHEKKVELIRNGYKQAEAFLKRWP